MRLVTGLFILKALSGFLLVTNAYNHTSGNFKSSRVDPVTVGVSSQKLPRWRGTAESFTYKEVPIPLPQVPEGMLSFLGNITSLEYGTSGIPFTTSGAYGGVKDLNVANFPTILTSAPSDLRPWSSTGKLLWDFGMFHF